MTPVSWNLRPWTPGEADGIASLLGALEQTGESPGAPFAWHGPPNAEMGQQSLTLVASRDDTRLLGAGTVYESPVAPARWRLSLHVHPAYRRQGIGTALLDALATEAAHHDDRALQVGLSYAATDSVRFFINRGFHYLMRTKLGTLDPARIPNSTWLHIADAEHSAQRLALRIRSLAAIDHPQHHTLAIAALHAQIYRQTHDWSPPAPLDPDQATAIYLGDDLIRQALFVAFDGDRPIGVSSLRHGESATDYDLRWTGVLSEFATVVPNLTLALLGCTFSFAQAAKRSITFEADAADTILWNLISTLPVKYNPDWINLER